MTPTTAPPFYSFAGSGWSLSRNLAEYADRSLTFSLAVTVLAVAIAGSVPRLTRAEVKVMSLGLIWLACGFALTILLPTRSSLYVVFPSVGSAIACAVICTGAWRAMPPKRQSRTALAALLVPVLLVPIYWRRNVRWTELAIVSRDVVAAFTALADAAPRRLNVIVVDDRGVRANIAAAVANSRCCRARDRQAAACLADSAAGRHGRARLGDASFESGCRPRVARRADRASAVARMDAGSGSRVAVSDPMRFGTCAARGGVALRAVHPRRPNRRGAFSSPVWSSATSLQRSASSSPTTRSRASCRR